MRLHLYSSSTYIGLFRCFCYQTWHYERKFLPKTIQGCQRDFHSSLVLQKVKETSGKQQLSSADNDSCKEKNLAPQEKSSTPVHIGRTEHIKPPQPKPELEESSLPTHDMGRITAENERLELKASNIFDELAATRGANKKTFMTAVVKYVSKESLYRRGAVEFIYAGLAKMKTFGVANDLSAYKALLQAFPEGKMIPRNAWQVEFMHYPRQQQCGIDLLEQMEHNGLIPDDEFKVLLKNRFGSEAHVTRKYRRMIYWLPKFKNMNPYPIPTELPNDPVEIALIALKRMCVDRETKYTIYRANEFEQEPDGNTFVASAQSPTQQHLISQHKSDQPLFVEGPYPVYLRETRQQYFLLRAEPNINSLMKQKELNEAEKTDENLFEWTNFFEEEENSSLRPILTVHEQEDSTILGLCITGTNSRSSAITWIRCLQLSNPKLAEIPVLFKIVSPDNQIEVIGDNRTFKEGPTT